VNSNNDIIPEIDYKSELKRIYNMGWVKSLRSSNTGIGYTLETLLGIPENNREGADFQFGGDYFELKSQRNNCASLITLFTKEPIKNSLKDVEMMNKYGYIDSSGRQALKITLTTKEFVPQGLKLEVDNVTDEIKIVHKDDGVLWYYNLDTLINKLKQKLSAKLVLVIADSKKENGVEYFYYNKAYTLEGLSEHNFMKLIQDGKVVIDFRMHIKGNGKSRNHGTAIRMMECSMPELFENINAIL